VQKWIRFCKKGGCNLSNESMREAANGIVKSSYFADEEAGIVIIAEDSSMDWLIIG
jgi:hypothetical protein